MSIQLDVSTRNAKLDAVETFIGPAPTLRLRTGAAPVNCAAADTGTVIATLVLPADWMADASGGSKAKAGTWQDLSADATGTVGHYRIYDTSGTCRLQGSVTLTGNGGDMTLDTVDIAAGRQVTITSYNWTEGNA